MRHPTTHTFLKWFGPSVVVFVGGCIGLVATLAQTYPRVKDWAEREFDQWWPIVTAPWFLVASVVAIAAYIWAVVWTSQGAASHFDHDSDTPRGGSPTVGEHNAIQAEYARKMAEARMEQESPSSQWFRTGIRDSLERQSLDRRAIWEAERAKRATRQAAITALRDVAVAYGDGQDVEFRAHLESQRPYADIRSHLSAAFLTDLNAQRTTWSRPDGARYGHLVAMFLDELDRLERDWQL
jgi:hypothetical protein